MTSVRTDADSAIIMRQPCSLCGSLRGRIEHKNGQDCVYCIRCNRWSYNQPRTESGRDVRTTSTTDKVKPKARARVLAQHGHQCISCGRSPMLHGVVLDIDHLIPLALAEKHGMLDDLVRSEMNMAPMCAECNRGKQDELDGVSLQLIYRVLKLKQAHGE